MDVASLIASFSTAPTYTVTRRARASQPFRFGLAQATTDSTLTIIGSLQPATGADLLRLPEGRRSDQTRVLFTATELLTSEQDAAYEADYVVVDGENWEVQHVETWIDPLGAVIGYRCIVSQPTPGGGP